MNKALAEIIAGVIPHKMTRNRWRGILRYGLLRAVRLKRQIRHNSTSPANYLVVCAIAKDEGPYFQEWIEWHLSQGVEKFLPSRSTARGGGRETFYEGYPHFLRDFWHC